jgi:hypothetical protein
MFRIKLTISFLIIISSAIFPGFDKEKECKEPCKSTRPKVTVSKSSAKTNVLPQIEKKKDNTSLINIHSSTGELKDEIKKTVQPNYSEAYAIEKFKILTREDLRNSQETEFSNKFIPSIQKIQKNKSLKTKEQDVLLNDSNHNDTQKEN